MAEGIVVTGGAVVVAVAVAMVCVGLLSPPRNAKIPKASQPAASTAMMMFLVMDNMKIPALLLPTHCGLLRHSYDL